MMEMLKSAIVSACPSLPYIIRRFDWLYRALRAIGLMSFIEGQNPRLQVSLPPKLAKIATAYRKGNIEYFVTGRLIQLQDRDVARTMTAFLNQICDDGSISAANILEHISEFRITYLSSPIANNHYGVNYATGLALFLITRHLNPVVIVESGVWRGMSSYLLRAAAPHAKIFAFDINLGNLRHRSRDARYHECDWSRSDITTMGQQALAFFDDHVNQARRVIEAHDRGFRYLLFDDSWSWGAISGCAGPPLPSIDMLMNNDLFIGEQVEWIEAGKLWTYVYDEQDAELCRSARGMIREAHDVPTLFRQTGIYPTSALKFVRLKD